jgi:acyl carrier protein
MEKKVYSNDQIKNLVLDILAHRALIEASEIRDQDTLYDDLSLDSFDQVETVIDLESMFSISLSDNEISDLTTVEALVNLVTRKVRKRD